MINNIGKKANKIISVGFRLNPDVDAKTNKKISTGKSENKFGISIENFQTMLGQIQEMLHIEKGGDSQLKDELEAYNPLIPKGKELVTTLMFEIDNPITRADFLGKVGGIEQYVFIKIDNEKIKAIAEKDLDRTSSEGKASSVQFLHFVFSDEQIKKFKEIDKEIVLGIDHNLYNHSTAIKKEIKASLIKDFI